MSDLSQDNTRRGQNIMIKWLKAKAAPIREKAKRRKVLKLRRMLVEIDPELLRLKDVMRNNAAEANRVARFGQPMLVDLKNAQITRATDLSATSLGRSLPGLASVGIGVMIYYVDAEKVRIGTGTELRDFSILEVGGRLEIGDNCVVGAYNWFQSSGSITIGKGCIIGPHCCIISTSHERPNNASEVRSTPLIKGNVTIGDNTWIGAHVSILKGVNIGRNVTIGAGSIVNKDIPDNVIAHGSPCRINVEL